jgi:hypothetical protein
MYLNVALQKTDIGLVVWPKWLNTCLTSMRPGVPTPVLPKKKNHPLPRHLWLMRIILATQEAEIRSIRVRSQTRQIVHKTLS